MTAVNYRSEPTDYRIEKGCAYSEVLVCVKTGDQPVTPSIAAHGRSGRDSRAGCL